MQCFCCKYTIGIFKLLEKCFSAFINFSLLVCFAQNKALDTTYRFWTMATLKETELLHLCKTVPFTPLRNKNDMKYAHTVNLTLLSCIWFFLNNNDNTWIYFSSWFVFSCRVLIWVFEDLRTLPLSRGDSNLQVPVHSSIYTYSVKINSSPSQYSFEGKLRQVAKP